MRKEKDNFLLTIETEQKEERWEKPIFFFFLSFFFLFILTLGINYGLRSMLGFNISRWIILQICLFSSLWTVILFSALNYKKIGYLITAVGMILYCFEYRSDILKGFKLFINHILERINIYYRARFTYFLLEEDKEKIILFAWGIFIFLITILCGYLIIKRKRMNIIFSFSIAVMVMGFLLGKMLSKDSLFLLAGVTFLSFSLEKNYYIGKNKSIKSTIIAISMIGSVFIAFLLAGKFIAEPRIKEPLRQWNKALYEWDSKVGKNIANSTLYKTVNTRLNQFFYKNSSGMLTNEAPEHTGRKVLSMTVKADEISHNLYLKGWVGSTYQNGRWNSLSEENFYNEAKKWQIKTKEDIGLSIQNLLYENLNVFPLTFSRYDKHQIFIEHLADLPYKYVPYGMKFENDVVPFGDGYIKKDNNKNNSYDGYFVFQDFIYYKLISMDVDGEKNPLIILWDQKNYGEAGILEHILRKQSNIYPRDKGGNLYVPEDKIIPSEVKKIQDKYRAYAINEYTKIPKEGLEKLKELCKDESFGTVWEAKEFITDYLHSNTAYSTNLKALSYGEDFVEHFLFEEKKGFCTHYATTATLMFRMLGFPARYVSGFVVTPSLYEKLDEGYFNAKVPDSNAHAWTEVYIEGKGWVPIEVTPGYDIIQEMASPNTSIGENNEVPATQKPERKKETDNRVQDNNQKEKKDGKNKQTEIWDLTLDSIFIQWISKLIWLFAGVLIIIGTLFVRRKIIILRRNRRLLQADDKKAVKEISYEIHRILNYSGYKKDEHVSDEEYGDYIGRQLDYWNKGEYNKLLTILRQVCFSEMRIREEDKEFCFNVYKKVLKNEKQKKKGMEAIYWKYILCY